MNDTYIYIVLPLIVGFFISYISTPFIIKLANKYGFIDDPKTHKHPAIIHNQPLPRAGGLPMYIALVIGSIIFFSPLSLLISSILLGGALVVIVGLLDDRYDLSPYVRFLINFICAVIVILGGVSLPFITNPLGGILHFNQLVIPFSSLVIQFPLSHILAVIWIVWVMNMLNWSKGVNGQMPGIAAVSALIIGIASLRIADPTTSTAARMAFLVGGAALGYLPYNFYGKMLPGYSSTILGFMLGVLSLISGVKLATAILVMGVPMTDAVFTIVRRLFSKRSPFWHDKEHLHHLFLQLGMGQHMIAILYWCFSLLLGFIALSLSSKGKLFAIILVGILVVSIILTLRLLIKRESENDE